MKVVGPWELIGSGKIRGDVEVLGNVDVKSPGRIRIDGGSSPATLENGAMTFGTGGKVEADVTNGECASASASTGSTQGQGSRRSSSRRSRSP